MAAVQAFVLLSLALVVSSSPTRQAEHYCYADITNPYVMFGSKTAYEFVRPQNTTVENIPNCQPVQVWMLCRHGTRYPKKSTLKKMRDMKDCRDKIIKNHEVGSNRGKLCQKDLDNLKAWTFNVNIDQNMRLAPQGEKDLMNLAQRMKKKFPTLLSSPYSRDRYSFRYTKTQRTQASAENFVKGLFGSLKDVYFPSPIESDPLIQDYENCTRYNKEVKDNDTATAEAAEFKEGDIMNEVKKAITDRLGFKDKLQFKKLDAMYNLCRFEKAWNVDQLSPWCAVLTEDELKVLDYYEDLQSYYQEGYGYQINRDLGCPPVKDFMDRISKLVQEKKTGDSEPAGVFYFSHAPMMHMVQAALGVHRDTEPLLDTNYERMQNRQWNTSKVGPFAMNIQAVLLRCSQGDKYRVKFYESEKPLDIQGCEQGLCSWEEVKKKFSTVAKQCNLDFCKMSKV